MISLHDNISSNENSNNLLKTLSITLNSSCISLNSFTGTTFTEKLKNLISTINVSKKNTALTILFPDDIIEITEDITFSDWTNKTIICLGTLYFKNCNGFTFKHIQNCNLVFMRISSNLTGLPPIASVTSLTTTGIKFKDCSYNNININQIVGFNIGIHLYSEYGSIGTSYNNFTLNSIWRCNLAIKLSCSSATDNTSYISGWVNENTFSNAMIDCNNGIAIGQPVSQRPPNEPDDNYHNNKFYNIGFEQIRDSNDPVAINIYQGRSNIFVNPRFEGSGSTGGYTLIREGIDAVMNTYQTSQYLMEIGRINLNTSYKKSNGKISVCNSIVIGDLRENTVQVANKMTALNGKVIFEATALWITPLKPNTLNWEFSDKYLARYKDSTGKIKIIGDI